MQGDVDYEAVAEQLAAVIAGKRKASPALLMHARDAAEALAQAHSRYPALRAGRPEHLTLEAAEAHADWLREQGEHATVVGRLMVVVVDEMRRRAASTEAALVGRLVAISFDAYGTPTTKLPSCWRCEEDELCCVYPRARLREWKCLRCNWTFEHSALGPEETVDA